MDDDNMLYLRYLRELLAEQGDPRAAMLLDDLPEHVEHPNSDWTLQAYMLHCLGQLERFVSPWGGRSVYESRLVHPVEQWLAWRYHGGAHAGQPEPEFADAAEARRSSRATTASSPTSTRLTVSRGHRSGTSTKCRHAYLISSRYQRHRDRRRR